MGGRDGTPRSVPIGRNYSIPYYLHVGNFVVPCIVDEVHKRINMLTRENTSRDAHRVRVDAGL